MKNLGIIANIKIIIIKNIKNNRLILFLLGKRMNTLVALRIINSKFASKSNNKMTK